MAYTIDFGQVESIVQDYYMPTIRDQQFFANAVYHRFQKRKKTYTGGRSIIVPLSFSPEGGGGQWWAGMDKMDTRARNPITAAQFYRKNYSLPITLMRDEEDAVSGPTALMELVTAKMDIARPTSIDAIGTALFNDGTDPKVIGGLEYALKKSISTTAPPTMTYGGISSSNTANTWWNHQVNCNAYVTGESFATLATGLVNPGFGPIGKMWSAIGRASGKRPTMILSNWGAYTDFHNALIVNERYPHPQQDNDLATAGFETVKFKNAVWVVDERAPHTSGNVESVYFLHEPAMNLIIHSKRNMSFDGWKEPTDQKVRIAYIDWAGEFILSERRCHGMLSNVNTAATS